MQVGAEGSIFKPKNINERYSEHVNFSGNSSNMKLANVNYQHMNLNIRYGAPDEVLEKIPEIYRQVDGWIGFAEGGDKGEKGIPYWFSFDQKEKHGWASVEPSGLMFAGLMEDEEWSEWVKKIKITATHILRYKVGEIELGEVDF
jgi:hypothetical protein